MSLAALALLIAAEAPAAIPASALAIPAAERPTAHYYPAEANAAAQVDGALAEAKAGGRLAVLVFGADWCSDSRALAAFLTSDMFKVELGARYNVVFVDVNRPTKGQGRNQDLVKRLGIAEMTGTPEVLVFGAEGKPLNSIEDAHAWRNAGDRSVLTMYRWFRDLGKPKG